MCFYLHVHLKLLIAVVSKQDETYHIITNTSSCLCIFALRLNNASEIKGDIASLGRHIHEYTQESFRMSIEDGHLTFIDFVKNVLSY